MKPAKRFQTARRISAPFISLRSCNPRVTRLPGRQETRCYKYFAPRGLKRIRVICELKISGAKFVDKTFGIKISIRTRMVIFCPPPPAGGELDGGLGRHKINQCLSMRVRFSTFHYNLGIRFRNCKFAT